MITLKDGSGYVFESDWLKIVKRKQSSWLDIFNPNFIKAKPDRIVFDFLVLKWYIWFKVASITQEEYEKITTQLFTSQFETKNNKENGEETVQL